MEVAVRRNQQIELSLFPSPSTVIVILFIVILMLLQSGTEQSRGGSKSQEATASISQPNEAS